VDSQHDVHATKIATLPSHMRDAHEINLGNLPKVLRKARHQLTVFWPNFWTRNARNSIKGSKNAYSGLESKNTASQNIGAWDRMMASSN